MILAAAGYVGIYFVLVVTTVVFGVFGLLEHRRERRTARTRPRVRRAPTRTLVLIASAPAMLYDQDQETK